MKAVYRRDPRLFYGQRKTHGFIGTLQIGVTGTPICDPQAVLTAIEAQADEAALMGDALMVAMQADAQETVTSGVAVMLGVQGEAEEICN